MYQLWNQNHWQRIIQSLKLIIPSSFSFLMNFFIYLRKHRYRRKYQITPLHNMLILSKFKLCWHVPQLDIWTDAMSHLGGVLHNMGSNLVPLSIMLHICTFAQHYGPGHQTNLESTSASVSCWLMYFLVISVNWELISFTLTDSVSEEPFHNKSFGIWRWFMPPTCNREGMQYNKSPDHTSLSHLSQTTYLTGETVYCKWKGKTVYNKQIHDYSTPYQHHLN